MPLLENLESAPSAGKTPKVRPGVEFDGLVGEVVTPGYASEPENFDEFLLDAGLDPADIEVIPPVRTSRWQQQKDGELVWLTSYRFTFHKKRSGIDLALLLAEADKKVKPPKKQKAKNKALVILWSDLQVGKVDHRGGTKDLIQRLSETTARLMEAIAVENPKQVIFCDLGDTIENFDNANAAQQAISNDLSIMEQVDLATTLAWRTLREIAEKVPQVTYASVGSNHCQWRRQGKAVGKSTDDWGVFIGRQLARLANETNANNVRFLEPQPHDESLAIDVFDDGYHILGLAHGHQARRPDLMATWWRQQAFGNQPIANATVLVHGHFHHLRVTEMGSTPQGTSRFLIMGPTMDNGSNWFRQIAGEDSTPGMAIFTLEQGVEYRGTVHKL